MIDKQVREYKLDESTRQYHREKHRAYRATKHKCHCGNQAYAKTVLSQEYLCAKCLVPVLKAELISQAQKQREQQCQQPNAPSVALQENQSTA